MMTRARTCFLLAIAACSVLSCGGGGSGKTCLQDIVVYKGSKAGSAYMRIISDDGLSFKGENSPSIQLMIQLGLTSDTCTSGNAPVDIPVTATAWIDITGSESAACADVRDNPQCHPAPGDPQGRQRAVLRFGQYNVIQVEVVDPP